MELVNHQSFISMLSEDLPLLCFFHDKKEGEQVKKIKDILLKIKKDLPRLPLYEYITDATDKDEYLCDVIEIKKEPILIVYKGGCFSRYKDKNFTEKEILKFLGNTKIYQKAKSEKVEVEVF